jgi:serine protease
VAGTIAARLNGLGVVGVAPEATVLTFRVFDDLANWAYASSVADAALTCYKAGARVINMSLGGPDYSSSENSMFAYLYENGVVSVAAAGNEGTTSDHYPASYEGVVSVAAVDSSMNRAVFSQSNSGVDISALGVDVYSTLPVALGSYGYKSGTSMACPHVAGVAALLLSKNPSATASSIVSAMTSTALDLGTVGRDDSFGYGLVDAQAALSQV